MDYIRILRRSFQITWLYRALWVFGFLMALTAGGGGGGGGGGGSRSITGPRNVNPFQFPNLNITPQVWNALIGIGIGLACVLFLIGLVFAIIRYVSEVALIRMANNYEANGEKVSVGTGFRWGWSRGAWRVFLIDLLVGLTFIVALAVLGLVAAAPLLLLTAHNNTLSVIGVLLTVALGLLFILALIVASCAVYLVLQVARRAVVLDGQGVMDGLRRGWAIVRRRAQDVIIMGLLMLGIGILFGLLMIPVFFILALVGGVAGGIPGLLAGLATSLVTKGAAPTIVGVLVGLPFFLLVLIIPMSVIGALYQVFASTVWTLTYRELLALEAVQPVPAPTPLPPAETEVLPQ